MVGLGYLQTGRSTTLTFLLSTPPKGQPPFGAYLSFDNLVLGLVNFGDSTEQKHGSDMQGRGIVDLLF
jgi:hypothetical protein